LIYEGVSCPFQKLCTICGQIKEYTLFPSKGKGRRKSYCYDCKDSAANFTANSLPLDKIYNFDYSMLDDSRYGHILYLGPGGKGGKWAQPIDLQTAIEKVSMKKATVHSPWRIKKLKNKTPFLNHILERDDHQCVNCRSKASAVEKIQRAKKKHYFSLCLGCTASGIVLKKLKENIKLPKKKDLIPEKRMNLGDVSNSFSERDGISVYCDASVQKGSDNYGIGLVLVDGENKVIINNVYSSSVIDNPPFGELCAIFEALQQIRLYLSNTDNWYSEVRIYSDVDHIERIVHRKTANRLDEDRSVMVDKIMQTISDLHLKYPDTSISINYVGNQQRPPYYNLAHKLSRSYLKGSINLNNSEKHNNQFKETLSWMKADTP
jgi:ribonuclease HI